MEKLALFDFDGTISYEDTLFKFIRYAVGDLKMILGLIVLSPMLVLYKLKLMPNYKAKELLLAYFFKGMEEKEFKNKANEYSLNCLNSIIRTKAIERIYWHKKQNHKVIIVSASIEEWLEPWCQKNDLELLATKLEFKNGIVSGKFFTKNCYGLEKVNRLKEKYDLSIFDYIYAYGDSKGDEQLLSLADEKFYKPFRNN
jgi:HAD superfamily hydrolase (TIGR01490 family)